MGSHNFDNAASLAACRDVYVAEMEGSARPPEVGNRYRELAGIGTGRHSEPLLEECTQYSRHLEFEIQMMVMCE